jgi:transcriptional regulator GlxA family with amidase domain
VTARRVVFVAFPDFQILDLTGPHEVFTQVEHVPAVRQGYLIETVSAAGGAVRSSGGFELGPTLAIDECHGPIDTLVVVGGRGTSAAYADQALIDWIARAARRARRTASVCSGAFLLAKAGLLDGRRAVTHWGRCDQLARLHPEVTVEADPIFVRDGDIWTSAGVTAGMDLALAMVENDQGADVAREIARQLVMFVQRPGGQAQFSTQLAAQRPAREPLRDVLAWIADHLGGDLTVPVLAARAGMSERHFTRVFAAEVGQTPAAYVEAVRVEAAQRLLEGTDTTIDGIARTCGFGTVETLHRCFKRTVRVTPGQYRDHFTSVS